QSLRARHPLELSVANRCRRRAPSHAPRAADAGVPAGGGHAVCQLHVRRLTNLRCRRGCRECLTALGFGVLADAAGDAVLRRNTYLDLAASDADPANNAPA